MTLLEVLVATALATIVLTLAVPSFRALAAPYMLGSTARLVATDCATARLAAIARNQRHRLSVNMGSGTWVIEREDTPGVFAPVGQVHSVPAGATIAAVVPSNPVFDSRGMLPATVTMTLTSGTRTRTVTVNVLGQATVG